MDVQTLPQSRLARRVALAAALVLALPAVARAQADDIYGGDEVEVAPRVAAPAQLARIVTNAIPLNLKGSPGKVQLEVVVGRDGKVEPESVRVIEASPKALGDALAKSAPRMAFVPGQKGGQPVRTRVRIPFEIGG